ncbi:hypothetical protein GX51_02380 [Blastomyces parvus]|uniref:Uncharacterized protein n=1 Tax=Blastomyces parvus TaxID=2060905 RepID=A0A2B7XBV7_9EURO|nr:hypothetical protein GX51_02380 [Blastomyces parvus]
MADAFTSVPVKPTLSSYWWVARNPPANPTTSFRGKTVLISGANVGLGFEAVMKFAALGASNLILGVCSLPKEEQAKVIIEARTGCSAHVIQLIELDMTSYQSVENFIQQVNKRFTVVHAAVLNIRVFQQFYKLSLEGWKMLIQVNIISTAYLRILLLPKLCETGLFISRAAHLEIVASCVQGDVNVKDVCDLSSILQKINNLKNFRIGSQYSISKLLVMTILGRTTEEGSRTLVTGTLLGPEAHGGFWTHDRIAMPAILVVTDEGKKLGTQCWKEILDLL